MHQQSSYITVQEHGLYPLCTPAQKLVEAKLKRVYAEGVSERTAHAGLEGQLALEDAELAGGHDASDDGDDEASAARADANMAALLAEMDLEGCGCGCMIFLGPWWFPPWLYLQALLQF